MYLADNVTFSKQASEFGKEIPHSHNTDQHMALWERAIEQ